MTAYSVAAFHVITGVCVLAAVRHLSNGLWRPVDKANLLFSVMCCCAAGMAWTQAQLYQAWSIEEHAALLKWNICFSSDFSFHAVVHIGGHRPTTPPWLIATRPSCSSLLALNLIQPFGVQLASIERIETKFMPWGESSQTQWDRWRQLLVRHCGSPDRPRAMPWFDSWRAGAGERSGTSMLMMLSTAVYLVAGIEGILVRAQVIDFIHLGPFGFFAMVIAMSLTLSFRSRQNLLVSEQRFRALVEQSPFGIQVLAADGGTVQVNPAWERLWGKNASENPRVADKRLLPVIERAFLGPQG